MKSLKKLFRDVKKKIDPEEIENYYGHGANNHDHDGHSHDGNNEHKPANKYKCPMKCEGDKTYETPGKCPVCNMNLKMVG
jgi:hypothetical protein